MKPKHLILTVLCLVAMLAHGQQDDYLPEVIPPSPEAASLGKFGDIPVGTYTGIPNISIPLHRIQYKDVDIPITLNYHAGGIKVEEEASWVGLGWALSAGGTITRSVRSIDDLMNGPTKGYAYADNPIPTGEPTTQEYFDFAEGRRDGQPDIFYFNLFGQSGRFVVEYRANLSDPLQVHVLADEKMRFEYNETNKTWTVWDINGYKYVLGVKEYIRSLVPYTSLVNVPDQLNFGVAPNIELDENIDFISTWYLSQVVTPSGETIDFDYEGEYDGSGFTYGTRSVKTLSEKRVWGCGPSNPVYIYNQTLTHNVYLKEIRFDNGQITFNTSSRTDMLPYTLPTKTYASPRKLDNIVVSNNLGVIKTINFSLGYFNSGQGHLKERLRLDSISESNSTETIPPHQFTYHSESLPDKNSYAQDHWGFYNGASNNAYAGLAGNATLIPEITYTTTVGELVTHPGANRAVDTVKAQAGILTQIKYPTGGTTQFVFESNDYNLDVLKDTPPPITRYHSAGNGQTTVFELKDSTEIKLTGHLSCKCPPGSLPPAGIDSVAYCTPPASVAEFYAELIDVSDGSTVRGFDYGQWDLRGAGECDVNFPAGENDLPETYTLPPGRYLIRSNASVDVLNPQKGFVGSMFVTYEEVQNGFNTHDNLIKEAGGLRIREIRSTDGIGNSNLNVKKYDYTYFDTFGEQFSAGKLMSFPAYGYVVNVSGMFQEGVVETCAIAVARSHSTTPLGSSAQGAFVGYDQVTESFGEQGEHGYSVYHYMNDPDEPLENAAQLPNAPTIDHSISNGLLTTEEHFDRNGFKIREVTNTYISVIENDFDAVRGIYVLDIRSNIFARDYFEKNEWWRIGITEQKDYDRLDPTNTKARVTTTNYIHLNADHKQVTKTTQTDSEGQTIETSYVYPLDAQTQVPSQMWNEKHMHSSIVEKTTTIDNVFVEGTKTHYYFDGTDNLILRDKVQQAFTGVISNYQDVVDFRLYDDKGNLLEYAEPDDVVTSLLWGYNETLPIARVTNATYAQLQGVISSPDLTALKGNSLTEDQIRTTLAALRTSLPEAQVTIYTYQPHLGISSITDPSGITTYYEYDELGRLEVMKDFELNKLQEIDYQYTTN